MTTMGMAEVLEFEEHFRNYGFNWTMRELTRFFKVTVREFYTTYKGELQR